MIVSLHLYFRPVLVFFTVLWVVFVVLLICVLSLSFVNLNADISRISEVQNRYADCSLWSYFMLYF